MRVRFPHSEICGSKGARPSPQLIAACYVLHRLCAPRHPPDALALTLDRSAFVPCPETKPGTKRTTSYTDHFREWYLCDQIECLMDQPVVQPANPAFTMSNTLRTRVHGTHRCLEALVFRRCVCRAGLPAEAREHTSPPSPCGLRRAAFSRFASEGWWSQTGSNRRPQACKASALPTELRPRSGWQAELATARLAGSRQPLAASEGWWARDELNVRPHAYQACALTT